MKEQGSELGDWIPSRFTLGMLSFWLLAVVHGGCECSGVGIGEASRARGFAANYGSACAAWDDGNCNAHACGEKRTCEELWPGFDTGTWCCDSWCYVEVSDDCDAPESAAAAGRHYSYEICGAEKDNETCPYEADAKFAASAKLRMHAEGCDDTDRLCPHSCGCAALWFGEEEVMRVDHAWRHESTTPAGIYPCYYRGVIIAVVDPRFDMSEAIVAKRFFNYKDLDSAAAFIRQTCKPQYVAIASVDEVCYHWLDSFTDALVWIGIPNYAIPSFLTNNGKEVYTQENMKLSCFRGSFALVGKAGCGE